MSDNGSSPELPDDATAPAEAVPETPETAAAAAEPETPEPNPDLAAALTALATEIGDRLDEVDAEIVTDLKNWDEAIAATFTDIDAHLAAERKILSVNKPPPPRCAEFLNSRRVEIAQMVSASLSGHVMQEAPTVTMSTRAWRETPRVPGLPRHHHSHRKDGAA